MPNALLAETATERLDLGLPMLRQLRISPTLRTLIDEAKPADQSYAEWFTRAAVVYLLLPYTLDLRLDPLNRRVVRITGETVASGTGESDSRRDAPSDPTAVRKPEQLRLKTAMVLAKGKR